MTYYNLISSSVLGQRLLHATLIFVSLTLLCVGSLSATPESYQVSFQSPEYGSLDIFYTLSTGAIPHHIASGEAVPAGVELTLQIFPDEGYQVDHWVINGVDKPTDELSGYFANKTTIVADQDLVISVVMRPVGYLVTIEPVAHGVLEVSHLDRPIESGTRVDPLSRLKINVSHLEDGYQLDYYLVNGDTLRPSSELFTSVYHEVVADVVIAAHLRGVTPRHTITLVGEGGGNLYGSYPMDQGITGSIYGSKDVPQGTLVTVIANPLDGHRVKGWIYNDKPIPEDQLEDEMTRWTFTVTEPATVYVTFAEIVYTEESYPVHYRAGDYGTITTAIAGLKPFESGDSIKAGTQLKLEAKPETGYRVDQWYVNGEPKSAYQGYPTLFTIVEEATDIMVTFTNQVAPEEGHMITILPIEPSATIGRLTVVDELGNTIESGDKVGEETRLTITAEAYAPYQLKMITLGDKQLKPGDLGVKQLSERSYSYSIIVVKPLVIGAIYYDTRSNSWIDEVACRHRIEDGWLWVENAPERDALCIYSLSGELLLRTRAQCIDLRQLPQGHYIVSLGGYKALIEW